MISMQFHMTGGNSESSFKLNRSSDTSVKLSTWFSASVIKKNMVNPTILDNNMRLYIDQHCNII